MIQNILLKRTRLFNTKIIKKYVRENAVVVTAVISTLVILTFRHQVLNLGQLAWQALEATLPGYNPWTFIRTYFLSNIFNHFLVGIAALLVTLMAIIGVPHLMINLYSLYRDLSRMGFTRAKWIARQRRCEKKYFAALSLSSAASTQAGIRYTETERVAVQNLISQARKDDRVPFEGLLRKWFEPKKSKIKSIPQALVHLLFSYDSFTRSAYFYTKAWNVWFEFRTFFPAFHPILTLTRLIYPNFYRVATSQDSKRTLPSKLNGGLRLFVVHWGYLLFARKHYQRVKKIDALILRSETLLRSLVEPKFGDEVVRFWEESVLAKKSGETKLSLSPTEAETIVAQARERHAQDPIRVPRLLKRITSRIDPSCRREVQIIQITNRQLHNPAAMARAVRSMIAANFIDKPIELIFLFASYSMIEQGILRPLHPEMFSSDSWFYLSRYIFFNGFIYSVIAGVFSDTWLKIQQDSMNEGKFGVVPEAKDAKKSFLRWYFEQTFFRKDNSFVKNQSYAVLNYIFPTLKATFVTAFIVNLVTMGRFDLDVYIAQTLVLILFPFTGLSWKLEQGFELASSWVLRNFPERLRSHPDTQAYAQSAVFWRRNIFNVFYKIWDCISWNFAIAFMTMNTLEFGTRSFSRILFGGYTPTELVANTLRTIQVGLHESPLLIHVIQIVDKLITNNYIDGTKLIF